VVARLFDEVLRAGTHVRTWSIPTGADRIEGGVYFARLVGPGGAQSAKVVIAP
jgi:hypothetical protein